MAVAAPTTAGAAADGVRDRRGWSRVVRACPPAALGRLELASLAVGLAVANGALGVAVWVGDHAATGRPGLWIARRGRSPGAGSRRQACYRPCAEGDAYG